MITGDQIIAACQAYNDHTPYSPAMIDSMRKALEAYEQSKWVKFDEHDKSTYPPFNARVLVKLKGDFGVRIDFMTHNKEWYNAIRLHYVTHWQPLPEFKE